MDSQVNIEIEAAKAEIVKLEASKSTYIQQYESAPDNIKPIFLELLTQVEKQATSRVEQIVQLERQKTILMDCSRPQTPAKSRSTTPMEEGAEMNITKFFKYLFYFMDGDIRLCVTMITKDLVITAGHCIPKDKNEGDVLTIFDQSDKAYEVKIVYQNKELDLALLQTVEDVFDVEPLEIGSYEVGRDYFALGYPLDEDTNRQFIKSPNAVKGCIMTRVVRKNCVYGSSGGSKGFSGGPVMSLDYPRELIGITLGGRGLPKTWPLNDFLIRVLSFCGESSRLKILPASTALAYATTANVDRKGVKRSGTAEDVETIE